MPIFAAIISGGLAYAGSQQAGSQAAAGTQAATDEARRQFDLQWEASAPSRNALARMGRIMSGEEDLDVTALPGYQERLQEGLRATQMAQAGAPGGRFGGRALKELTRYGSTFAGNERSNYLNRLASLAGMRGDPSGANIPALMQAGGQQQAGITMAGAQGINQAIQGGMSNWMAQQNYNRMMASMNPQAGPQMPGAGVGGSAGASIGGI